MDDESIVLEEYENGDQDTLRVFFVVSPLVELMKSILKMEKSILDFSITTLRVFYLQSHNTYHTLIIHT